VTGSDDTTQESDRQLTQSERLIAYVDDAVLCKAVPVRYVRKDYVAPLPYPTRGGTVESLKRQQ
jgi:hypothetical protein